MKLCGKCRGWVFDSSTVHKTFVHHYADDKGHPVIEVVAPADRDEEIGQIMRRGTGTPVPIDDYPAELLKSMEKP